MKALNAIRISGKEILPLIEGGKGISVSNGQSSGAWAAAGGAGAGDSGPALAARGRAAGLGHVETLSRQSAVHAQSDRPLAAGPRPRVGLRP